MKKYYKIISTKRHKKKKVDIFIKYISNYIYILSQNINIYEKYIYIFYFVDI